MAARFLQSDLRREPDLIFGVWQALLPKQDKAPRLGYVVAKKGPAAEELTVQMMRVLAERRRVVEEMQSIVDLTGQTPALYAYFGVEHDEDLPAEEDTKTEPPRKKGGLLDL